DEASFGVIEDYPRRRLTEYQPRHATKPDRVVTLTYELEPSEVQAINDDLGFSFLDVLTFSVDHLYDNKRTISLRIDEAAAVKHLLAPAKLSSEVRASASAATSAKELLSILAELDLNEEEQAFTEAVRTRFGNAKTTWDSLVAFYIWEKHL